MQAQQMLHLEESRNKEINVFNWDTVAIAVCIHNCQEYTVY